MIYGQSSHSRKFILGTLMLVTFAAHAQRAPRKRYIVTDAKVTLKDCGLPKDLTLAIDDDVSRYTIKATGNGAEWLYKDLGQFEAGRSPARAYFGTRTTDCQTSKPDTSTEPYRGRFLLTCLTGRTSTLTISAPAAKVAYVRAMTACQQGWIVDQEREVRGVLFSDGRSSGENVRLQFGLETPNPDAPGLLVHDPSVIRDGRRGDEKTLDRNLVVAAVTAQRAAGRLSAWPALSPNAIDCDMKSVTEAGLTTVHLKVK